MVKLICGKQGTGKTQKMIDFGNNAVDKIKGKIVFLEANNKHMYDLHHDIRYINTKEHGMMNADQFLGFVSGLLAADYDIEHVYIDGLYKIAKLNMEDLKGIIDKLNDTSKDFEVDFYMSVNFAEDELDTDIKKYILN
ncbi:MAG: hypothetical protein H0S78_10015 [Tissierellales bacterium]|nr:hypothetical protein [Tissierellales bacterium]HCX03691.1 hypothetical protein [Clostridiales bacterium]